MPFHTFLINKWDWSTCTSLPTFGVAGILILVVLVKCEMPSYYGFLVCISLVTDDVEYLSVCLLVIGISFAQCLSKSFVQFLIGVFVVLLMLCSSLSYTWIANIFFQFVVSLSILCCLLISRSSNFDVALLSSFSLWLVLLES